MLYELFSNWIPGSTIVFECLQDSIRDKIEEQTLTFCGAVGSVVLEAVLGIIEVVALLVDIVFSHLVV